MVFWGIFIVVGICTVAATDSGLFDWCPPKHLRPLNESFRSTIITEIHGNIIESGRVKTFLPGHQLDRFLYYHIGVFGIDSVHLNILYDPELVFKRPSVEDIYPRSSSCAAAWYDTGRVHVHYIEHGGPESRQPIGPNGKPTLVKNAYRTTRGINPVFNGKY